MDSPVCCQACHTLYPLDPSETHFRLFGLPTRYDLDPADLHRRFLSISRQVHPDFFGGRQPEMQALALRLSARINEAYETLRDPVLRAEYLLEISGGKSSAECKSVPGCLLADIMMMREDVERARAAGDHAAIAAVKADVEARRAAALERIASLSRRLPEERSPALLDELRREINGMKFLENFAAEL